MLWHRNECLMMDFDRSHKGFAWKYLRSSDSEYRLFKKSVRSFEIKEFLPDNFIPTAKHFIYRQYWHWVRVVRLIMHFLSFIHLYFRCSSLADRRKNFLHASLYSKNPTITKKQTNLSFLPCYRTTMPTTGIFPTYLTWFRTKILQTRSRIIFYLCVIHLCFIDNKHIHIRQNE